MEEVITIHSTIQCVHEGNVVPLPDAVSNVLVVDVHSALAGTLETSAVSACSQAKDPCTAVATHLTGTSKVLFVDEDPVLLATAAGTTMPTLTNSWKAIDARQDVLTAD
ncbi:hypothetical protein ACFVZZ_17765 [Streptomyces chartreusis]|uniref:hypothetical protein n=1 Tax=Streptomyces chartreusis TaxID=1969 RepID=UPI0036DF9006